MGEQLAGAGTKTFGIPARSPMLRERLRFRQHQPSRFGPLSPPPMRSPEEFSKNFSQTP